MSAPGEGDVLFLHELVASPREVNVICFWRRGDDLYVVVCSEKVRIGRPCPQHQTASTRQFHIVFVFVFVCCA